MGNACITEHFKEATQGSEQLVLHQGDKSLPGLRQVTNCAQPSFHAPVCRWQRTDDASLLERHWEVDEVISSRARASGSVCQAKRRPDSLITEGTLRASSGWDLGASRGCLCARELPGGQHLELS